MKTIRIPLEQFDLDAFVDKIIDFIKSQVSPGINPIDEIVCVEKPGDHPDSRFETESDVMSALQEGRCVFFPFAYADPDGLLTCANGESHQAEEDEEGSSLVMGETDSLGYLIQIKDDEVSIVAALHGAGACVGPSPSVDLCRDCGVLEEPMADHLDEFVRP